MPTPLRIPLAEPLTNRDGTATKDSQLNNCSVMPVAGQNVVVKRPGTSSYIRVTAGQGQGLACINNRIVPIVNNVMTDTSSVSITGWANHNVPDINNFCIAWGVDRFILPHYNSSTLYWSYDGITWSTGSLPVSGTWVLANYNGNKFLIVSNDGHCATSSDGVTWSAGTISFGGLTPAALAYGSGVYVITSLTGNTAWYSYNGLVWYVCPSPTVSCTGLAYGNGTFVGTGGGSTTNSYMYSPDGIHWTTGTLPTLSVVMNNSECAFGNGIFLVTGNGSTAACFISRDNGVSWIQSALPSVNFWQTTIFSEGLFFLTSSSTSTANLTTTDGINFVTQPALPGDQYQQWAYSPTLKVFCGCRGGPASVTTSGSTRTYTTHTLGPGNVTSDSSCSQGTVLKTTKSLWTYVNSILTEVPKKVLSVTVTNPGSGGTDGTYSLGFSGGSGTGAAGTYTITGGIVVSTTITAGGTGYTSAPTVSFPSGGIIGAAGTAVLNGYPATTVPGLAFLDDTYYVMDEQGTIYGSNLNDALTWDPLNFIKAGIETDCAVAIARQLSYVVAFKETTTEFFYDAANTTGSPLSSVPNAYFRVGCASADSIAKTENQLIWIGQTSQKGRKVMVLDGFQPQVISTPEVDRILYLDSLAKVYAYAIKINGGTFYILTLPGSNKTLVYNFTANEWSFWTSLVPKVAASVTSITSSNGVATVTQTAHEMSDGDPVTIAGATPTVYNGLKNISYVDANHYTFSVPTGTASPATGTITAVSYAETYFNKMAYSLCDGVDYLQGESDGITYYIEPTYYDDNGSPINMMVRTVRVDGNDAKRKFNSKAEIIGDKIGATAYLRYTDDDYQSYCKYRPVDLSAKRSMITRLGHTRRRAYEIKITDNKPIRLGAIEIDMEQGTS